MLDDLSESPSRRCASAGILGLDHVLGGGLPRNRLYLIHGRPGVGKTTLALQFLLSGAAEGERGVYFGLSESEAELRGIGNSHGWSLDGLTLCDVQAAETQSDNGSEYTFFHPAEVELSDTTRAIFEVLERTRPGRIVFDSLSELRLMARDSLRYRRQILALKKYFSLHQSTVLMLDTRLASSSEEFQLETLAHGVLCMEQISHDIGGNRRRLRVEKLRGVPFLEGFHDFRIRKGGLEVFPRLASRPGPDSPWPEAVELFQSGLVELDELTGGGLAWGSTTMLIGPAGVGKSTLATQYISRALDHGEPAAVFLFDESTRTWAQRADWLGTHLDGHTRSGHLQLRRVGPAELSPGELAETIRLLVDDHGVRVVVIDSINGYASSMPGEGFLSVHLHELVSFLNQRDVLTLLVAAQHGFVGDQLDEPAKLSYLADNVIVLRYFEAFGSLRKAIAMIKNRSGDHDRHIRELQMAEDGLRIGEPLREFQGIFAGELVYSGSEENLIHAADDKAATG